MIREMISKEIDRILANLLVMFILNSGELLMQKDEDGSRVVTLEFDLAELAVAMIEGFKGQRRPEGMSAAEVLASMDPELRYFWVETARHALSYILREIKGKGKPN